MCDGVVIVGSNCGEFPLLGREESKVSKVDGRDMSTNGDSRMREGAGALASVLVVAIQGRCTYRGCGVLEGGRRG